MSKPPVEVRLDLTRQRPELPVSYRGWVELPEGRCALVVEVARDERAADGLACSATALELPDGWRAKIEHLAGSIARKAVRAAQKDGLLPPRRIRRWRAVRG